GRGTAGTVRPGARGPGTRFENRAARPGSPEGPREPPSARGGPGGARPPGPVGSFPSRSSGRAAGGQRSFRAERRAGPAPAGARPGPGSSGQGAGVGDLAKIFKAYDIRGVVPDELDTGIAEAAGAAFVRVTGASALVTAHDMRESAVPPAEAFAQGAAVAQAGLRSSGLLDCAGGSLDLPGAMAAARHGPARYDGLKLCRAGARPIGSESGLAEIREMIEKGVPAHDGEPGTVTRR